MKVLMLMAFSLLPLFAHAQGSWPQWSGDERNNHNVTPANPLISKETVAKLRPVWVTKVSSSVIETPTSDQGQVYFTDIAKISLAGLFSGGHLYAADAKTGNIIWKKKIQSYTKSGLRNFSRSSPAIGGDRLVIGDSINNVKFIARSLLPYRGIPGTSVMAINRHTGKLIWKTEVEKHFSSRITMSPIIYQDKVLVGVSSIESEIPAVRRSFYRCCSFRGSFVALSLESGKILWKTPTIGSSAIDNSGASVWGNSPPIDRKRNRIYVGTGNNYHVPKAFYDCYIEAMQKDPNNERRIVETCAVQNEEKENRFDSLLALDLDTGKIIWSLKTSVYDAWNLGCGSKITSFPPRNRRICPRPEGLDGDFGQAPMFLTTKDGKDILIGGQKNGMFWAVDAEDGTVIWKKQVGPRGSLGGHQWGSASDGESVYYQTTNMEHKEVVLEVGPQKGTKIRGGYWGALNALTGELIWQTADPSTAFPLRGEGLHHILYGRNLGRGFFAAPMGPLTYYNGLIFAGSLSGQMVALDAADGKILWSYKTRGSVVSAPSIVNDQLFWGTGYHLGFQDHKLYSFGL